MGDIVPAFGGTAAIRQCCLRRGWMGVQWSWVGGVCRVAFTELKVSQQNVSL